MIIKKVEMVKGGFTMHIEYCRDGKDFDIEITPKMAIENYEAAQQSFSVDGAKNPACKCNAYQLENYGCKCGAA